MAAGRASSAAGERRGLLEGAGRLTRLGGRNVLRLTENPATEALYGEVAHRLAA